MFPNEQRNLISKVVQEIPPSGIRKYFDFLDDSCISLGAGQPDFATPMAFGKKRSGGFPRPHSILPSNAGMPELRELILKYLEARFDIKGYSAGEVLVTVGGMPGERSCHARHTRSRRRGHTARAHLCFLYAQHP